MTLVGGILEYGCLGTRIGRARCGGRALLGSHDEEDGGRWRWASALRSFRVNKMKKSLPDLIFFSHAVGHLVPDTYTLVLPKMESCLYFILSKNCLESKRFELHLVSGSTLKKTYKMVGNISVK